MRLAGQNPHDRARHAPRMVALRCVRSVVSGILMRQAGTPHRRANAGIGTAVLADRS